MEVDAVDEVARLSLIITIELTIGGLIRARAEVINLGEDPYAVRRLRDRFPDPPACPGDPGLRRPLGQGAGTATSGRSA